MCIIMKTRAPADYFGILGLINSCDLRLFGILGLIGSCDLRLVSWERVTILFYPLTVDGAHFVIPFLLIRAHSACLLGVSFISV